MKYLTALCSIFLLISCNQDISQNNNVSPTPIYKTELTETEKAEKLKRVEKDKQDLEKFINEEAKYYELSSLANKDLPKMDLEIRIWRFAAFGEKHLAFVLKKSDGNWSAKLVQRTIAKKDLNKGSKPPMKYSRRKLNNPKSGWENLWQKLTNNEILTLPTGSEISSGLSKYCLDCWEYVVETKVENNYRVYNYFAPEDSKEIREAQQMVKIINIISEEFNLTDFDPNNFI